MNELFDAIGGQQTIDALVTRLYKKTLATPELYPFFDEILADACGLMNLESKQRKLLAAVIGDSGHRRHFDLRRAHAELVQRGLGDSHFDLMIANITSALNEIGLSKAHANEIVARVQELRGEVLGRDP